MAQANLALAQALVSQLDKVVTDPTAGMTKAPMGRYLPLLYCVHCRGLMVNDGELGRFSHDPWCPISYGRRMLRRAREKLETLQEVTE